MNNKSIITLRYSVILLIAIYGTLTSCSKSNNNGNSGGGGTGGGGGTTPVEAQVNILLSENKQVIQGFGCATVFNPPNTSPITSTEFDRLFGSGSGQVGLNILRIRIASDDAWRATELDYAKAAIQRGAKVIASPWSPPANMKTNNNIIGGSLKPDSAEAYAKYLNAFADFMAANGAAIYSLSVQNEPDISVTYESCDWTATDMRDFIKNYGHLVTSTKLMAPESFNNNQNFVNTILSDNTAANNLDIVGGHIYGGGVAENTFAASKAKEVWMTEHLDTDTSYTANLNTAVEIHNCFTVANFNAYCWWYGKRFYGLIGQDGIVTKRGYIMSHFAKFIKSGSVRLGTSANTRSDVLVSAYHNAGKKIIIAINTGSNTVNQKFLALGGTINDVIPYTTTSAKNAEQGTKVTISSNSFSYTLPPYSITSFVEM